MRGFEDDDGPEEGEFPDVFDVVEVGWLDDGGGADEPVEGGEAGGAVVGGDRGGGVGCYEGHCCAGGGIGWSDGW